ncbi:unnamed protein product [Diamesa serratosioi]
MDLNTLNDLLECSVCLERLKPNARVLPCQHTFCFDCLKQVSAKHPGVPLTCPECRRPTNTSNVDQLPKNVFLIRLLDGMKINNGPTESSAITAVPSNPPISIVKSSSKCELDKSESKNTSPTTATGDSKIVASSIPFAKALYDFKMGPNEDEGCLVFRKGSVITVTRRVDQNWAEGKICDAMGIFPLSFVELNAAAVCLLQSLATGWKGNQSTNNNATASGNKEMQPPILPSTSNTSTSNISPQRVQQPQQVQTNTTLSSPETTSNLESQKSDRFVALHSYVPQKTDELELKKGQQYIVKERCHDGWYKGVSTENPFRKGVFPGNYLMPLQVYQKWITMQRSNQKNQTSQSQRANPGSYTNHGLLSIPPDLPPRNNTRTSIPETTIPSQNMIKQDKMSETSLIRATAAPFTAKLDEKQHPKKESVTEMLMKRLGYNNSKRSTDPSSYSMDNPVFEDVAVLPKLNAFKQPNPLEFSHMRSGSCPVKFSQPPLHLESSLQLGSQRVKPRERPSVQNIVNLIPSTSKTNSNQFQLKVQHRKSSSLDTTLESGTSNGHLSIAQQQQPPALREKYRCIEKYPANSRFELSLNVGDIVWVHKKRDNGWFKGELSSGQVGLFPASFVEQNN